ncbi:hypothetical protein DRJ17_00250 [Candidatus Woesearchaeota archaeon]|nr:MAG: hypothetical protein DRJ17_00250 [Candidatus Woesearchaeota archaeon]
MGALEDCFIANEVRVDSTRNYKLHVSFQGLGEVYCDWKHTFPTTFIYDKKHLDELIDAIEKSPLKDFKFRVIKRAYPVVQLDAPIPLVLDFIEKRMSKIFLEDIFKKYSEKTPYLMWVQEARDAAAQGENPFQPLWKNMVAFVESINPEAKGQLKNFKMNFKNYLEKYVLGRTDVEGEYYSDEKVKWMIRFCKYVKARQNPNHRIYYPFSYFSLGYYNQQARWRVGNAGGLFKLDPRLIELLRERKNIQDNVLALEDRIDAIFSSESGATRMKNELVSAFKMYNGRNLDKILTGISKTTRKKRIFAIEWLRNIMDEISDLENRMENMGHVELRCYCDTKNKRLGTRLFNVEIHLDSTDSFLYQRMLNADEIRRQIWIFFDFEKPLFGEDEEKLSYGGFLILANDKPVMSNIYTIHKTGIKSMKGFVVKQNFGTVRKMLDAIIDDINKIKARYPEKLIIYAPFNAKFDLLETREQEGGFLVGARKSDPIKEVSREFGIRIGVRQAQVYDFFWQAQLDAKHLPRKKLDVYELFCMGDEAVGKSLSYDEMRELEWIAISNCFDPDVVSYNVSEHLSKQTGLPIVDLEMVRDIGKYAAQCIVSYLIDDVVALNRIFDSERGRKCLRIKAHISEEYGIELTKTAYYPSPINDAQEKLYFEKVGTFRKVVYPENKFSRELAEKSKTFFSRYRRGLIKHDNVEGVFHNVHQVYLPWPEFLADLIAIRFSENGTLESSKLRRTLELAAELDDPYSKHHLSQYIRALAGFIIKDYGDYQLERNKLTRLLKKSGLAGNFSSVRDVVVMLMNTLDSVDRFRLRNGYLSARKILNFRQSTLFKLTEIVKGFGMQQDDPFDADKTLVDVINTCAKYYHKKRKFKGQFNFEPRFVREILGDRDKGVGLFLDVANKLKNAGFSILKNNGDFLYVIGDARKLPEPTVHLQTINSVLKVKDRLYYKVAGQFAGIKIREKPSNQLCVYESRVYAEFLDRILSGNVEDAAEFAYRAIMNVINADNIDLVWYVKSRDIYNAYDVYDGCVFFYDPYRQPDKVEYVEKEFGSMGYKVLRRIEDLNLDMRKYRERLRVQFDFFLSPFMNPAQRLKLLRTGKVPDGVTEKRPYNLTLDFDALD